MKKILLIFFYLSSCILSSHSQNAFYYYDSIIVINETNDTLNMPWTGGLSKAQFSEIDLNQDGVKDLFIFEKDGFTIRTFINERKNGKSSYSFAPEYINNFPKGLQLFVLLRDYNCDGREDLFTRDAGVKVYKNEMDSNGKITFSLVSEALKSVSDPSKPSTNVYIPKTGIPVIDDIDNDGDLDILSFGISGGASENTVNHYKNLSMENSGTCDSLAFNTVNTCWGQFFKNSSSNSVTTGFSCTERLKNASSRGGGGITMLTFDRDADGDKELVFGHGGFKNFIALTNGGDKDDAQIIEQELNFPKESNPVNINFPAGFYLDVTNDGLKDLVVSTHNSSHNENSSSIWLYENTGTNNAPIFQFKQKNFLQNEMIDVGSSANPTLFDYNADGLLDLIVGNYSYYSSSGTVKGKLALFKNVGTTSKPSFKLITRDYANISSYGYTGLSPTFGDLDNDGDIDMIIGDFNGEIHYFQNLAGAGNTANFDFPITHYMGIDVRGSATPQLVDLNDDHLLDLLIGQRHGNINYFENTGTLQNAFFSAVPTNDSLGNVIMKTNDSQQGYSHPYLTKKSDGTKILYIGSQQGVVYYYGNISAEKNAEFTLIDSLNTNGYRSTVALGDLFGRGVNDLIVGDQAGGLFLYKRDSSADISISTHNIHSTIHSIQLFPNPVLNNMSIKVQAKQAHYTYNLKLFDLSGRQLFLQEKLPVNTIHSIPLADLSTGIYLAELQLSNGERTTRRIIKY